MGSIINELQFRCIFLLRGKCALDREVERHIETEIGKTGTHGKMGKKGCSGDRNTGTGSSKNVSIHWSHRNLIFSLFIARKFWLYFPMIYEYVWCHKIADFCPLSLIFHSNKFQVAHLKRLLDFWKYLLKIANFNKLGQYNCNELIHNSHFTNHGSHIQSMMMNCMKLGTFIEHFSFQQIRWIYKISNNEIEKEHKLRGSCDERSFRLPTSFPHMNNFIIFFGGIIYFFLMKISMGMRFFGQYGNHAHTW